MLEGLDELNHEWKEWMEKIDETIDVTIGINSGEAQVGNIGSKYKFKYGAQGDPVNIASRVQTANRYFKSRVLVSGSTRNDPGVRDRFLLRRLGRTILKNIPEPVDLFELDGAGRIDMNTSAPWTCSRRKNFVRRRASWRSAATFTWKTCRPWCCCPEPSTPWSMARRRSIRYGGWRISEDCAWLGQNALGKTCTIAQQPRHQICSHHARGLEEPLAGVGRPGIENPEDHLNRVTTIRAQVLVVLPLAE
jgi:hypothetical protein